MSQSTHSWEYGENEEAELFFLALAARHHGGQQQTPVECNADLEDDESDADSCCDDEGDFDIAESTVSSYVADPSHAASKKKFLDHFAELLARKKDPNFVSCNILSEERAAATVFFTRNGTFDRDKPDDVEDERIDREFFDALSAQIAGIQRGLVNNQPHKLYDLLLGYYKPRLRFHAREMCKHPKVLNGEMAKIHFKQDPLLKEYLSLAKACSNAFQTGFTDDKILHLPTRAYGLSRSSRITHALLKVCDEAEAERTIRHLRFVARLRAIHKAIYTCARTVPSFASFSVRRIPSPPRQAPTAVGIGHARTGARRILKDLSIPQPKWLKDPRFPSLLADEYRKKLVIHAEMQAEFFLRGPEGRKLKPFPYLGISKKTCFICSLFLKALKLETRPSHGRLHPHYTLPRAMNVSRENVFKLGMALKAVKQELAEMLCRPPGSFQPHRHESTTVLSSRIPSSTVSMVTSQLSSRLALAHTHDQRTGFAGSRAPAAIPSATLMSPWERADDDQDHYHNEFDLSGSVGHQNLRVQFTSLIRSLRAHFDELPNVIQTKLSFVEFEIWKEK